MRCCLIWSVSLQSLRVHEVLARVAASPLPLIYHAAAGVRKDILDSDIDAVTRGTLHGGGQEGDGLTGIIAADNTGGV